MTRSELFDYASNIFSELLSRANVSAADDVAGIGTAIDETLRTLGVAESALSTDDVPAGKEQAALALSRYFTCCRILDNLAAQTDANSQSYQTKVSQAYEQTVRIMDRAAESAAALGYPVAKDDAGSTSADLDATGWGLFSFNADYIEPEAT